MYTQCPHCQTCFRIAEAHLKAAKGQVRCGSCKEVFTATDYLYDGVPSDTNKPAKQASKKPVTTSPATKPQMDAPITPPAAPPVTPPPAPKMQKPEISAPPPRYNEILPGTIEIPEEDHQHIDLSAPPDRSGAPDQSPYMESLIGDNSRYNNLDELGSIKIPGEADFTESFIKYVGDDADSSSATPEVESKPAPEDVPVNPYSDTDAIDSPATTQEREGIEALFSNVDDQLSEPNAEQIDKHLEALLDGDLAFDDDHDTPENKQPTPGPLKSEPAQPNLFEFQFDEPKLAPLDDEDEPIEIVNPKDIWASAGTKKTDTSLKNPSDKDAAKLDAIRKKAEAIHEKKQDDDDLFEDFLANDSSAFESATDALIKDNLAAADDSLDSMVDLDDFLADDDDLSTKPDISFDEVVENKNVRAEVDPLIAAKEDFGSDELNSDDITSEEFESADDNEDIVLETGPVTGKHEIEEDLPSLDHDIPKALRSSFENFEPPIRHAGLTMAMVAAIVVLVIGLLGQSVLFRSYQLANQMPSLSPMLTSLCSALPCRYSGSIDTTKIEVRNRDMRSHPNEKNALLVSTAIVNNATFDQPYPILAIKLFDLSGHTVATRYFKPEEYLESLYSKFLLMESGTPVRITLAVLDPGDDAVNFEITFM